MARNRNDSGGSNHAQMRASFADTYRKQIGKQEMKKNVKLAKEITRRNDLKVTPNHVYRDLFIVITALLVIFISVYLTYKIMVVELADYIPDSEAKSA